MARRRYRGGTKLQRQLQSFVLLIALFVVYSICQIPVSIWNRLTTPAPALIVSTPTPRAPALVTITTPELPLRAGPGLEYEVLGTLPVGTEFPIKTITRDHQWVSAEFSDRVIWMPVSQVSLANAENAVIYATPTIPKPTPKPTIRPAAPASGGGVRVGAICRDGSRSSATGRGACSRHGGVSSWVYR